MTSIQPKLLKFGQLLHGRLYRIPSYQRSYSWTTKQREDLFGDIERTWSKPDSSHFMATVVALRRDRRTIITDEYQAVEIVDGQQRLTTLILLLNAIANAVNQSDETERKIAEEIRKALVKSDDLSLLLLQTNHDTSNHFADYIRTGTYKDPRNAATIADRRLLSAMKDCERFVAEWQEKGLSLQDLTILLKNRLTFVFYEIADEAQVYTVFEVLNSRGLEVSWFDRLKSMLMAIVFESGTGNEDESIQEVHQLWTDIYARIGLRLGLSTESLRFAATLRTSERPSRPMNEESAALLLRELSKGGPADVIRTTKWLKEVTDAVDNLASKRRTNAVTRIAQARLLATAVYLSPHLTREERKTILRCWEKVTFRLYGMLGKDARTAVGDYVRLAWDVANQAVDSKTVLKKLRRIGRKAPIDDAIDNLRETNCYEGWREELRYLLYRYEEYLANEAGQNFKNEQWNHIWMKSAANSIEHILPQSRGEPELVHRLGNLLILPPGLNSKLKDKPPKEKEDSYLDTGLYMTKELKGGLDTWNLDEIEEREKRLLDWARQEWSD